MLCSEWYENFPVVLLEAFAAGKPVIGSALGSLQRLIESGRTGLLFEAGSPRDLAEKMELLSNSPDLRRRMGEAARSASRSVTIGTARWPAFCKFSRTPSPAGNGLRPPPLFKSRRPRNRDA